MVKQSGQTRARCVLLRNLQEPEMVPPVPTPATNASTLPSVCSHTSGPAIVCRAQHPAPVPWTSRRPSHSQSSRQLFRGLPLLRGLNRPKQKRPSQVQSSRPSLFRSWSGTNRCPPPSTICCHVRIFSWSRAHREMPAQSHNPPTTRTQAEKSRKDSSRKEPNRHKP